MDLKHDYPLSRGDHKDRTVEDQIQAVVIVYIALVILAVSYALSEWQTIYPFKSFSQFVQQEWTWYVRTAR